jgi:FMN-dependent NADH-azoreductase
METAMTSLLFVTSSVFGANSKSRQIAGEFIETWRSAHADTRVTERDLTGMPHLSGETLGAIMPPAEQRTAEQQAAAWLADQLIEEVEAADTIVIAAPMYNLSIPSTLKAWFDHVARAGRTFRYTAAGPEGLVKGKKVFVVTGRGGIYSGNSPARSLDFHEPYLRAMLGFIGIDDVTFIHVEGLNLSPEAAARGIERARQAIERTVLPLAA